MTLTPSQRRSWARHGDREIQRTIDEAKAEIAAQAAAQAAARPLRRVKAERPLVDLASIRPGDQIVLVTGATAVVRRVNKATVTTESGVRWTAAEVCAVIPS